MDLKFDMLIDEFIDNLNQSCEPIVAISAKHMLNKLKRKSINRTKAIEIFSNFDNYTIYLNDIAGQIYRRHNSSTEHIYRQLCDFLDIQWDNKSLYESRICRLDSFDTQSLDNLDEDMRKAVLDHHDQQSKTIEMSRYYVDNIKATSEQQTKI